LAAVASQVLNVYLRAVFVELKASEHLDLIERKKAIEEVLEQKEAAVRLGSWLQRLERDARDDL
jgi:predicted Holliday junction resolvase-like endonuclease